MENTEEPIKLLVVGLDDDTLRRHLLRLGSQGIVGRKCSVSFIDPGMADRLVIGNEINDHKKMLERIGELILQNHSGKNETHHYQFKGFPSKRPRDQRIPHRQRGDKRKHPH